MPAVDDWLGAPAISDNLEHRLTTFLTTFNTNLPMINNL
jgi:hypothetical protein